MHPNINVILARYTVNIFTNWQQLEFVPKLVFFFSWDSLHGTVSDSLVVLLSPCSYSNFQCLFMWFSDYLCFIRTPMIPVVAIIPSGKTDPENVCLAESVVDDWYSSLCSTLTEPNTTCDQSVAGTNACRSLVFLWYLMWKQRFCILSLVCSCLLSSSCKWTMCCDICSNMHTELNWFLCTGSKLNLELDEAVF